MTSLVDLVADGTFDAALHAALLDVDDGLFDLRIDAVDEECMDTLVLLAAVQQAYRDERSARERERLAADFSRVARELSGVAAGGR